MDKTPESCSFCGRSVKEIVGKIVISKKASICKECLEICGSVFAGEEKIIDKKDIKPLQTPRELHKLLNDFVIGQDNAKKTLSVAVYNHYKRLNNNYKDNDIELDKSNILLIGPTGSGKTLLAKTLAKALDVPFAIADATTLTEAGYVGDDVENVIKNLLSKCNFDKDKAEKGIIFIDEIDKISRRSDNPSITRDVSGEGVQQAMLKLIEGTIASVPPQGGRKHPEKKNIEVDTTNILFICGGAFGGLDKIVQKRIAKTTGIGFAANVKKHKKTSLTDLFSLIEPDDLIRYGLIPEIIGRLPINTSLEELDEKSLIAILTKPKNAIIKQYQAFFDMEDVKLEFKNSALAAIAKLAIKRKIGARGLRSILEQVLLDTMYNIPHQKDVIKVIIDKEVITGENTPLLIRQSKSKNNTKKQIIKRAI